MSTRYTKEELEEYFFEALAMFNDVLESDIISENVVLDFLHLPTDLLYISGFARNIFLTNMKSSTKLRITLSLLQRKHLLGKNFMVYLLGQI